MAWLPTTLLADERAASAASGVPAAPGSPNPHTWQPPPALPGVSFEQLQRCDWGTQVTVAGQPVLFNQAGKTGGRKIIVVLGYADNPVLKAHCWRRERAGAGENAYYVDYDRADLRIGTPPGMPLLRDQAATCLRPGDTVLADGQPASLLELWQRDDELRLTLRYGRGRPRQLQWTPRLDLRLTSASPPTFEQLRQMPPGTRVTLGRDAAPANLKGTIVQEGTRQFVLVDAAPGLGTRAGFDPGATLPGQNSYTVRFQEAGLRLVSTPAPAGTAARCPATSR